MVNLKHLFKEYNCSLNSKQIKPITSEKKTENPVEIKLEIKQEPLWPEEFLPGTKYSVKTSENYLEMTEKWSKMTLVKEKSKKIVKILTKIDTILINAVKAEDLISYEGTSNSIAISHILNMNSSLQMYISTNFSKKKIFSMLKYALKYQNYNLIHILTKSLQSMKLSAHKIEKLIIFKDFLEKQNDGIFPFDWMLQDCEDSNLNITSEVASLRFCKIIDKLKSMKQIKYDFKVSEKNIHIMFSELWKTVKTSSGTTVYEETENDGNLFLVL